MVEILKARNNSLVFITEIPLSADYMSPLLDFHEMNSGFIQVVTTTSPANYTGEFLIKVSLLCEPDSFIPHPDSERTLNDSCNNFGWSFCCIPFRYARLCYTANSTSDGEINLYARGKRT